MKDLHYGDGYMYAHNYEGHITAMQCLPDSLKDKRYYLPSEQGVEGKYKERLEAILKWKQEKRLHTAD